MLHPALERQLKKLALACALIHGPQVILLDEPTTGVDPVSRRDFWLILGRLLHDGLTIVVTTPYLDEAERCATIAVLDAGHLMASGPPPDIVASSAGTIVSVPRPVHPARAWRLGREYREWWPPGEEPTAGTPATVTLEDVIIAGSIARRPEVAP